MTEQRSKSARAKYQPIRLVVECADASAHSDWNLRVTTIYDLSALVRFTLRSPREVLLIFIYLPWWSRLLVQIRVLMALVITESTGTLLNALPTVLTNTVV